MKSLHILGIIFIVHCMTHLPGSAISCFQCNSSSDIECSENFDLQNTHLQPTSCDHVYDARYCVKTTGIYGGLMGTQRFCSSRHIGNQCEYIKRVGDVREQRSCVFTCSGNGCNSSYQQHLSSSVICLFTLVYLTTWIISVYSRAA